MATYTSAIDALNAMCTGAGAAGGHTMQIDALNALAVKLGKPGGYTRLIDAYNAIAGGSTYRFDIQALNDICGDLGLATSATIDTAALTLVANAGFAPSGSADVVFLSGFNGANGATAATDEATGKTITFAGNARLDTAQFKFGTSSLLLDGTDDYLTLADHADWTIGSNQFTIEAWVRFGAVGFFDDHCILAQAGTTDVNFYFYQSGGTSLRFAMGTAGGASGGLIAGTWAPVVNTWYHVAVDRDAVGKVRLYANGVMIGSGTDATVLFNSPKLLYIGRLEYNAAFDFQGHIDELRFTNGTAHYASDAGFAVPTAAFPR